MTDNMATCEHAEPIAVTMRIMNAKAINVAPLGISPRNLNIRKNVFLWGGFKKIVLKVFTFLKQILTNVK